MGPPAVEHDLPGWVLAWRRLELLPDAFEAAAQARHVAAERTRRRLEGRNLADLPVVAAVRRLFRQAGTDPTRYRPSSEALLRRLLKGEALPAIQPLVDLNNCLSVLLVVPSCVMAAGTIEGAIRLRRGRNGERMESLRGDFDLADKPLLADVRGPFGTPITDSRRVAVDEATRAAWLVAYLPAGLAASAASTPDDGVPGDTAALLAGVETVLGGTTIPPVAKVVEALESGDDP